MRRTWGSGGSSRRPGEPAAQQPVVSGENGQFSISVDVTATKEEIAQRQIEAQEKQRLFGVLPNFFRLTSDAPEITANLWGFARFGYLDNPLPSLFKERLFV